MRTGASLRGEGGAAALLAGWLILLLLGVIAAVSVAVYLGCDAVIEWLSGPPENAAR